MWTISQNKDWDQLMARFDWLQDMQGVPQDPLFHAEGDVAIHTRMVVECLLASPGFAELPPEQQEVLFAAALLHDVEKRSTTIRGEHGNIRSPGHARKGELSARSILYRYHAPAFEQKEAIAKLVRYHGLPLWVFDKPNPHKALWQASLEVDTKLLVLLARADVLGRICNDQKELLYRVDLFEAFCKEQGCYGQPKSFASHAGRYHYFQRDDASPDYRPYEGDAFEVVLFSALPGSGKDTFISKHYKDWPMVSIDSLRRQHRVAPTDKKQNGRMVQLAKEQARIHLRAKRPFIWNATNITRKMRGQLIDLFQSYGARCKLVYIEVPYEKLLQQNRNRKHVVPEKVLHRMIDKIEIPAIWEAPEVQYECEQTPLKRK